MGEPPLFLAASVLFALRAAIAAARAESGVSGYFRLDSPATCERIRMACQDQFTQQVHLMHARVYTIIAVGLYVIMSLHAYTNRLHCIAACMHVLCMCCACAVHVLCMCSVVHVFSCACGLVCEY